MEIYGYKCVNKDKTNRYGITYELNKTYTIKDPNKNISFGNNGYGFHFCLNLEDTLRYFDAINNEVIIYLVKGFGDIIEYEDEYNGFYNMYVSSNMEFIKELTREEIINYALTLNSERIKRFISLFKLNDSEINLIKNKYNSLIINQYIEYYQYNNKEAFNTKSL